MSGTGAFPFDPEHLARLSRLSAEINGTHAPPPLAPPPIATPIALYDDGFVNLPVPGSAEARVVAELHPGLTLQWVPMQPQGGAIVHFRGGEPDGYLNRDAVAVFLTRPGLRALIADLQAIAAQLEAM